MELKNKKINFLGDSITEGGGASSPENNFVSLIQKEYGAICRNYGVGGSRIAKQKNKDNNISFCERAGKMDPDADIVVVFGGTNDFGSGDLSLGCIDDRTTDTFYGTLHSLYSGLMEQYIDSRIVIITPLHRTIEDNVRGEGCKNCDVGNLKMYVDIIREVAEYYSFPVLDLWKESGLQPKVPACNKKYFIDGLHPNDAGYKILADKIAHFLMML